MKKVVIGFGLVLLILSLNGCTSAEIGALKKENEELRKKIEAYDEKIKNLENEIESMEKVLDDSTQIASISYIDYTYKQRFVPKEIKLHVYPQEGVSALRTIEENTVVRVIHAGISESEDRKLWLYVNIPVYDTPMDCYGWIREEDTEPYTKETQKLVQSDVTAEEGTEIFEVFEFEKIQGTQPTKLPYDVRGRIEEKKEGYVRLSCPGGWDFWLKEEYIHYPDIE